MERRIGGNRGWPRTVVALLAALAAISVGVGPSDAAAPGPSGTIYVRRISAPPETIAVRPDGTGATLTGCPGDRTMSSTGRRVLVIEPTGETFPAYRGGTTVSQLPATRLVSTDDGCGDRIVLAELPVGDMVYAASWSLDGSRVAAAILRYAPSGQLLDQGVWVGEVGGACGSPLCAFHLAAALPMVSTGGPGPGGLTGYLEQAVGALRWSPDGRRVTYSRQTDPADPYAWGIFVADLGAPGSTALRQDEQVPLPGGSAYQPAFSPVAGDDRIAYVQATNRKSCFRNDIFITSSAGGTARRVGTSTLGMCQLGYPDWSPDGQWLVFDAWSGALADSQAVYRFRADGSGKVVLVLADRGATYRIPTWRR